MKRKINEKDILSARTDLERIRILIQIIKGTVTYESEVIEKMSKFKIIESRVEEILEQFPETRENDHLLYVTYLETYHYTELNEKTFVNYKDYNLPPFTTIERSARDIRKKNPHLRGTADIQENREEAEKEYREYYKK